MTDASSSRAEASGSPAEPQLGQAGQLLDARSSRARRTAGRPTPPPGAEPRTRAPAPRTDQATGRHRRGRPADAPPPRRTAGSSTASPTRNRSGCAPELRPNAVASASRCGAGNRSRPSSSPATADAGRRTEAPSPTPRRSPERTRQPSARSPAYSRRADLPIPASPRSTKHRAPPRARRRQQLDRALAHSRSARRPAADTRVADSAGTCHPNASITLGRSAGITRCPSASTRTPSAVVTRPANTNAVWRNDASRSNGSSAEIASRGITTCVPAQRGAGRRVVHADVRDGAADDQRVDAPEPQQVVERGAVERVVADLAKHGVVDARARARRRSPSPSCPRGSARARSPTQGRRGGGCPGCRRRASGWPGPGPAGARSPGRSPPRPARAGCPPLDEVVLHVDHDQRRPRRVDADLVLDGVWRNLDRARSAPGPGVTAGCVTTTVSVAAGQACSHQGDPWFARGHPGTPARGPGADRGVSLMRAHPARAGRQAAAAPPTNPSRKGSAMDVKDKVAVVTGGAQGIGLALCTRFAQEGAHVVLSDLDQEACERAAAPIGALPVAADVGREEDVANLVSATVERFGRIDLFVSNAGIAVDGGIDTPNDGWRKIIGVNLMSRGLRGQARDPAHARAGQRLPAQRRVGGRPARDPRHGLLHGDQARRDRLHRVARGDVRGSGHRRQRALPGGRRSRRSSRARRTPRRAGTRSPPSSSPTSSWTGSPRSAS